MKNAFFPLTAASLLAVGLLSGCSKPSSAPTSPNAPPAVSAKAALTVSLVPVEPRTRAVQLAVSGNVMPWQESVVGLEVGGQRIMKVLVNVGDVVRKGQVLATLRTDTLQAELLGASASLADAQATLAQAQATLARSKRLAPAGGVSEQELSQQATAVQTAQAKVAVAQAQVTNAQLKVDFATLRAPDDGVISSRTATEGTIASAGSELFRLIRQSKLEWRAEVPADQMHLVKPGSVANVTAPDGTRVEGSARQVAPTVDLNTRNGLVYVDIPQGTKLKAGMHLSGVLQGPERQVAVLALSAVTTRDGRSYVFTVVDGAAKALEVQLGTADANSVEVLSGVEAGTLVIAQGVGFLKDGDRVHVVPKAGAQQ